MFLNKTVAYSCLRLKKRVFLSRNAAQLLAIQCIASSCSCLKDSATDQGGSKAPISNVLKSSPFLNHLMSTLSLQTVQLYNFGKPGVLVISALLQQLRRERFLLQIITGVKKKQVLWFLLTILPSTLPSFLGQILAAVERLWTPIFCKGASRQVLTTSEKT